MVNFQGFFKRITRSVTNVTSTTLVKRGPELLVGLGFLSFATAVVLAVRATPKAEELIIEAEDEKEDSLTPVETVKAGWKPFVAPAIAFGTGVLCVSKGLKIRTDQYAETAAALAISRAMLKRMEEKNEEVLGKEKADEIKSEVNRDVARSPMVQDVVSKLPPSNIAGVHPFWDPLSNTPFYASVQMLEKAEVKLNKRLFTGLEPYITISDLYDELNEQGIYPKLRHTAVSPMMGWTADAGGIEFDVDVDGVPFEQDHWEDGTPCYVMSFKRHHEPDYIR